MDVAEALHAIGSALIGLTAVLAIAAVVVHQLLARWWETEAGRHAFTFELALALSLTLWAVRLAVPEGDWFLAVRLIAFALVPIALAWRIRIIVQIWRRNRRRKDQP
ncbi:hypothetical protein AB0K40_17685 [Nonomuraea bangladeshensis]|uniref:DUF1622 domain-containing protein n=1 Tax=Nonomuraea bangladeshensis TaxID=404385 RepID=A0ABV3H4R9_9ACTN